MSGKQVKWPGSKLQHFWYKHWGGQWWSGWVTSKPHKPNSSNLDGILADVRARCKMALMAACLEYLPLLHLQLRTRVPTETTSAPQWRQRWGTQMVAPNLSPTAVLKGLSSNLKPSDETGRACNHAPAHLTITTKSLTQARVSCAEYKFEVACSTWSYNHISVSLMVGI